MQLQPLQTVTNHAEALEHDWDMALTPRLSILCSPSSPTTASSTALSPSLTGQLYHLLTTFFTTYLVSDTEL